MQLYIAAIYHEVTGEGPFNYVVVAEDQSAANIWALAQCANDRDEPIEELRVHMEDSYQVLTADGTDGQKYEITFKKQRKRGGHPCSKCSSRNTDSYINTIQCYDCHAYSIVEESEEC